jgi:hypothetical protein
MDRIPTELLHEIFIKLDLKDKLKCMLVCRFWYATLDRRSLLHELDIDSDVFLKLIQMIESHPHRAAQVESLYLFLFEDFSLDKRVLCNMFPNLKRAILSMEMSGASYVLDSPFQFTHSSSKLEEIVEGGECELTRQLAMSNMCSNLKSLKLYDLELPSLSSSDIISQLKNMPALETLSLHCFQIKLMDLERLHHNLLSIK